MDVAIVAWLAHRQIRCNWPPAKTTEFTAPSDDKEFGTLKRALINLFEAQVNLFSDSQGVLTSKITEVLPGLIISCMTKEVIISSFAATGTHPWNPDLLRKRAREAVEIEILPETPQKGLIRAVKELLSPPRVDTKVCRASLSVDINRVFTSEQVRDLSKKQERKRKLDSEEKQQKEVSRKQKKAERLELAEERGRTKRAKMVAKGDKKSADWENLVWLDANTCRCCRKVYASDAMWECPNCETFWYCKQCVGFARWKLEAHESECEDCMKIAKSDAK